MHFAAALLPLSLLGTSVQAGGNCSIRSSSQLRAQQRQLPAPAAAPRSLLRAPLKRCAIGPRHLLTRLAAGAQVRMLARRARISLVLLTFEAH